MEKTRGAHSFRPQVRQGPTPPAVGPSPAAAGFSAASSSAADPAAAGFVAAGPSVAAPSAAAAGASPSVPAVRPPAAVDAKGSSSVVPAQRRYYTRVGPTPPVPTHPRPARRAPPAKRARTSSQGESSTLRSKAPPSPPYRGIAEAPDLSSGSIIRRPYFPYDPIPGNVSCRD